MPDISIDLNVPFRILAWRIKAGMENVPYFKIFRVI